MPFNLDPYVKIYSNDTRSLNHLTEKEEDGFFGIEMQCLRILKNLVSSITTCYELFISMFREY